MAWIARKALAKLISTTRSKKVGEHYRDIGGFSPIRRLTEHQARALAVALKPHMDTHVVIAMRYWRPTTQDAVASLARQNLDQIILLPLYPQYSYATTRSSFNDWNRRFVSSGIPLKTINHYYDHPDYIAALVEKINLALAPLKHPEQVHLIFSAHGLPMKLVQAGDPYPKHIEATVQLVREMGEWNNPHVLCYQSRVGPQKWLEPSLTHTIEKLAHEGVKRMLIVPIAFVTDHIETLHEINIEARAEAIKLGIEEFTMMPALNDSPLFIQALADVVLRAAGVETVVSRSA
jgi:protoporphyrin/coproporphyrin ferrochelatase